MTLEFLLSRNQLICPLLQSETLQKAIHEPLPLPRLAPSPAITHLHPNQQFTLRLKWHGSDLESPVYLTHVLASMPLPDPAYLMPITTPTLAGCLQGCRKVQC